MFGRYCRLRNAVFYQIRIGTEFTLLAMPALQDIVAGSSFPAVSEHGRCKAVHVENLVRSHVRNINNRVHGIEDGSELAELSFERNFGLAPFFPFLGLPELSLDCRTQS